MRGEELLRRKGNLPFAARFRFCLAHIRSAISLSRILTRPADDAIIAPIAVNRIPTF